MAVSSAAALCRKVGNQSYIFDCFLTTHEHLLLCFTLPEAEPLNHDAFPNSSLGCKSRHPCTCRTQVARGGSGPSQSFSATPWGAQVSSSHLSLCQPWPRRHNIPILIKQVPSHALRCFFALLVATQGGAPPPRSLPSQPRRPFLLGPLQD